MPDLVIGDGVLVGLSAAVQVIALAAFKYGERVYDRRKNLDKCGMTEDCQKRLINLENGIGNLNTTTTNINKNVSDLVTHVGVQNGRIGKSEVAIARLEQWKSDHNREDRV